MTTTTTLPTVSRPAPGILVRVGLPLVGLVAAALAIASAPWALDRPWLNLAFKPVATLAIIVWVLAQSTEGRPAGVRRWILAGLVASLAGDIALLWPQRGFLAGLVSFLVGPACYLVAFVGYAALAAVILSRLWPGVPAELHVPVVVYVAALAAMAAQTAAVAWRERHGAEATRWRVAGIGGALFLASDATLAADRFAGGVP